MMIIVIWIKTLIFFLAILYIVKMSNLMRVLTNEAIQDPTKAEAQVRREMQRRQETHIKTNEERKLTEEQRKAKRQKKLTEDAKKGTIVCVFK
jgi:U4/U6 small nuclear ribonucleoprotein PRP3